MKKLFVLFGAITMTAIFLLSGCTNHSNTSATISDDEKAYISEKESIMAMFDSATAKSNNLRNFIKLPKSSSYVTYEDYTGIDWDTKSRINTLLQIYHTVIFS